MAQGCTEEKVGEEEAGRGRGRQRRRERERERGRGETRKENSELVVFHQD